MQLQLGLLASTVRVSVVVNGHFFVKLCTSVSVLSPITKSLEVGSFVKARWQVWWRVWLSCSPVDGARLKGLGSRELWGGVELPWEAFGLEAIAQATEAWSLL